MTRVSLSRRPQILVATVTLLCALAGLGIPVAAQRADPTIHGTATAQAGTVLLPGVVIILINDELDIVGRAFSGGAGEFELPAVPPGSYRVEATLDGFVPIARTVTTEAGEPLRLDLAFDLAQIDETVQVVSPVSVEFTDITAPVAPREVFDTDFIQESPTSDDSIQSALPLLPGVVRGPDGINIKGGRPTQSALQVGDGSVVDPATGNAAFTLPSSAIESVEVMPNPYSVEYGRFTSGLTIIEPRRGEDAWEVAINNPVPAFHTRRGRPLDVIGIRGFSPSFTVAGPLIPKRLFLAQSAQYRFSNNDIRSRPQDERRTRESFNIFTRLDAVLTASHRLGVTIGIFPEALDSVGLDTFNPPTVTPDIDRATYHVAVSEVAALSTLALFETTAQVNRHREEVSGAGTGAMELFPEERRGSFFNAQDRRSTVFQWLGSWSGYRQSGIGGHLFKVGADVQHVRFSGASLSAPVNIRRLDGTVARAITFGDSDPHALNSTDVALYAQNRWQANDRLLLEFGLRLDRDGVLARSHGTPRFGAALNLNRDGTMAVRGGIGLFYERTASTAGVFDQFESRTVTDFAVDGTRLAPPTLFIPRTAGDLDTARGRTWHLEYQHRITPNLTFSAEHLRRVGSRELIVEPVAMPSGAQLRLSSDGASRYRETGLQVRYARGDRFSLDVTYVYAKSSADLNAFSAFFNTVRMSLIRDNAFAPTDADVPHRLLARARIVVAGKWRFVPLLEVRNGFPYTAVDERWEFMGVRNSDRHFPAVVRFDVAAERQVALGGWRPWLGVRILNVFDRIHPRDVQNILSSPRFGEFFNSDPLQARITVRMQL